MKRIHLFEFEDFDWFPGFLRACMTNYIQTFHKLLDSATQISELISPVLAKTSTKHIVDLCSGAGGPMLEVLTKLKAQYPDARLTLTDLYPNQKAAQRINRNMESVTYQTTSVRADQVDAELKGVRTMICSLHHMNPQVARSILADAQNSQQPFLAYEISDNSFPRWLWWMAFPINIFTVLFATVLVRPMTWQQLVFTYLIPILPIVIAWDGAVSNARTYTLQDMDILLSDLPESNYTWEKGALPGKGGRKLYLLGMPK